MPETPSATSGATAPAGTTDAIAAGRSGNVSVDQAAAQLFANAEKQASLQAAPQAAEETAAPKGESTPEQSAAEAVAASAEVTPEATAAATAETPATDETDAVLSQTSQFTPEQQKIFDKRVGKEMGRRQQEEIRRKEAEAKAEALEARLAEVTAQAVTPHATPPAVTPPIAPAAGLTGHKLVDEAKTPAELETLSDNATTAIGFAEDALENPNLGHDLTDTVNVDGKDWTRGELNGLRKNAREALVAIPKKARQFQQQANFFTAKQQATAVAHKEFPFLTDKKSPEYQQAQAMLRDPWVAMRPDAEWIVGVQIRGLAAMEAAKNAVKAEAEKPKPKAPPAAKPSADQATVSSAGTALRSPGSDAKQKQLSAEREKLNGKKGITAADAVAHLTRIEQSRNSR